MEKLNKDESILNMIDLLKKIKKLTKIVYVFSLVLGLSLFGVMFTPNVGLVRLFNDIAWISLGIVLFLLAGLLINLKRLFKLKRI